jgi:hypothetical protein
LVEQALLTLADAIDGLLWTLRFEGFNLFECQRMADIIHEANLDVCPTYIDSQEIRSLGLFNRNDRL